jgi:hypothetical protein
MHAAARPTFLVALCLVIADCSGQPITGPTAPPSAGELAAIAVTPGATPVSALPEVFVGAGDIATCADSGADATSRLLDGISGLVFALGDNAYPNGTAQQYRDCYAPAWGRHRSRTRPVPGNHEYDTAAATPYFDYFSTAAGPSGLGFYSFDLGSWHIVALNSNIPVDGGSSQVSWLRQDLAAHPAQCTLAYWHHPLFSSGSYGSAPSMRNLWLVLYAAGADMVLNGHEHFYERFAPQDPGGAPDNARGLREFIVGTGGAPLRERVSVQVNSERVLSTHGVLKLTLRGGGYDWDFVSVAGPSDSGTEQCH